METVSPVESPEMWELLRPDLLVDGKEPEQRVVHSGISWERYLAFDKRLGDDRPGPRLYYLDGEMEIMTTSNAHERIKCWTSDLMALFFDHIGIEVFPTGQATMREIFKKAGAEPDLSWYLYEDKEFPDIVVEIALTSGGIRKLDIYRQFPVPEVWIWRRKKFEIFVLNASGAYEQQPRSKLLPDLDFTFLGKCVQISSWSEARRTFRERLK